MNNTGVFFNILSLCIALISLVAIVLSFISFKESSITTLKVNSKEHKFYKDLKYSILQVIASERSIDAKATVSIDIKKSIKEIYQNNSSQIIPLKLLLLPNCNLFWLSFFLNSIEDSKVRTANHQRHSSHRGIMICPKDKRRNPKTLKTS